MNPSRSEHVRPVGTAGDDLVAAAAVLSSASLHEAARRTGALPAALKPIDPAMRLCGRALPVRCPAGDNLWIHRALAEAGPGEVLVAETAAAAVPAAAQRDADEVAILEQVRAGALTLDVYKL